MDGAEHDGRTFAVLHRLGRLPPRYYYDVVRRICRSRFGVHRRPTDLWAIVQAHNTSFWR